MLSPETFLDTIANQQISVGTFLSIRDNSLGLNPRMAVIEAIEKEANTLDELWLGNVSTEPHIIIFSFEYSLAAGAVRLAEPNREPGLSVEQAAEILYKAAGYEITVVRQAE